MLDNLFERLSHEAEQRIEVQLEKDVISKEDFFSEWDGRESAGGDTVIEGEGVRKNSSRNEGAQEGELHFDREKL